MKIFWTFKQNWTSTEIFTALNVTVKFLKELTEINIGRKSTTFKSDFHGNSLTQEQYVQDLSPAACYAAVLLYFLFSKNITLQFPHISHVKREMYFNYLKARSHSVRKRARSHSNSMESNVP